MWQESKQWKAEKIAMLIPVNASVVRTKAMESRKNAMLIPFNASVVRIKAMKSRKKCYVNSIQKFRNVIV